MSRNFYLKKLNVSLFKFVCPLISYNCLISLTFLIYLRNVVHICPAKVLGYFLNIICIKITLKYCTESDGWVGDEEIQYLTRFGYLAQLGNAQVSGDQLSQALRYVFFHSSYGLD